MGKRVLVLGGGTGGYVAARKLAEAARKQKLDLEVTLLTASPWHEFQPLFADVAFNTAIPDETRAPVENIGRKFGPRVIIDKVVRIDAANRVAETEKNGELDYDYLVVSLGVRYGWEAYPGLAENGVHNYTLEGAMEMAKELARFRGGRIVILVPETPHRCGMYPYEAATQLAETMRNRGVKAEIVLMTREARPLTPLGPDISRVWEEKMDELGVEMVQHNGVQEIDGEKKVVRAGNVEERYDLLIKVPPSRLPDALAESEGFQLKGDPRWAPARAKDFRHPEYDDVFMVGEHSMPAVGLPTAGIPVHFAAEYAAEQIASEVAGGYPVPGYVKTMTCVGYFGTSGFAGTCEICYDESTGRRKFVCYTVSTSPIVRLMKEAFYKSWIAALK